MVSCILVTLETSSATLSKSGNDSFSITLSATTDTHESVTIDPFWTLLDAQRPAFDNQGFSFKDSAGTFAVRNQVNVLYSISDFVAPDSVIEIPPKGSKQPFTITHALHFLEAETDDDTKHSSDSVEAELARQVRQLQDDTTGLEIGHRYELGLGTHWNAAQWWRVGSKDVVFRWRRRLSRDHTQQSLPTVLLNKVVVHVVD